MKLQKLQHCSVKGARVARHRHSSVLLSCSAIVLVYRVRGGQGLRVERVLVASASPCHVARNPLQVVCASSENAYSHANTRGSSKHVWQRHHLPILQPFAKWQSKKVQVVSKGTGFTDVHCKLALQLHIQQACTCLRRGLLKNRRTGSCALQSIHGQAGDSFLWHLGMR